jgi:hypothetical protein
VIFVRSELPDLKAKGRPRAGLFAGKIATMSRLARPAAIHRNPTRNKPLMACKEHWKSFPVLPMFRTHPLASDPGCSGDARPNATRSTRLELPIWMK